MIVVDASVVVTLLCDDGSDGRKVRNRLIHERMAAPELIDLEVLSVLRRLCAGQQLDVSRASQAAKDLADLRIDRVPHRALLARCWDLRNNVTVYDASYVAAAEAFDVPLLTSDAKLAAAPGPRCTIELIQ